MTSETHPCPPPITGNLPPLLQKPRGPSRVLRRLLGVDRPIPARAPEEIEAETARNYRWNFAVNVLDGTSYGFGESFISAHTILPLFISKLTPNPLAVGLLGVVTQSGWLLPQLFTANTIEHLPRSKPVVVNLGLFLERVPLWVMILSALVAGHAPMLGLALFLLTYTWRIVGAGIVATAWQNMIANCFPVERRGRYLGLTNFLGAGLGIIGAGISAYILETTPFPTNFAIIFAVATLLNTVSWVFLALTRETPRPNPNPPPSERDFLRQLPVILRQDHNFRRYLTTRVLGTLGGMGLAFITIAALARWHIPDSIVGLYTTLTLIGQTCGNVAGGLQADRYGHKHSLVLGGLAAAGAFLIAWLAAAPAWYYAVFGLMGLSSGIGVVSGILIVMEFSPPAQRPTYVGLANTISGITGIIAPLLGAALAAWSYSGLFALSALAYLVATGLLIWRVKDPRSILAS